jgi:hypothetical protein
MKSITILFILVSISSFAQYPRKANVAILQADHMSSMRLRDVCVDVLESEGLIMEELNNNSMSFTTDSVVIHELPLLFKMEIIVDGEMAAVRGYVKDDRDFASMGWQDIPQEWEDAAFKSLPGSIWRTGFKAVVKIVEKIRAQTSGTIQWDRW